MPRQQDQEAGKEEEKGWEAALESLILPLESVALGFSGGVDSAVLAVAARRSLGPARIKVVLVDSPSLARREKAMAEAFAAEQDLSLVLVQGREFDNPRYLLNAADRCYHCKSDLFLHLRQAAESWGLKTMAYGANADDASDFRPGHRAAWEAGIRAPLAEAGLGKNAVRRLAKAWNLSLWDKPAAPCLSSRIPHGLPVSLSLLARIEAAEAALAGLGFRAFRVRAEGEGGLLARVEVAREEWPWLGSLGGFDQIKPTLIQAGFESAQWDESGLRSGNLSDRLSPRERQAALRGMPPE